MGAGKTLSQSVFAEYMHAKTGVPIYANYKLKNALPFNKMSDLWAIDNAIVCIDEIWISMDARLWKDNVTLTRFINQSRKKRLIIIYTTQHIRQVEMRVRNATDFLVLCEKKAGGHWLHFCDWQNRTILRSYFLDKPDRFWYIYDTFELVTPIIMDSNPGEARDFKKGYKGSGGSFKRSFDSKDRPAFRSEEYKTNRESYLESK